jgi:hypothetical protein
MQMDLRKKLAGSLDPIASVQTEPQRNESLLWARAGRFTRDASSARDRESLRGIALETIRETLVPEKVDVYFSAEECRDLNPEGFEGGTWVERAFLTGELDRRPSGWAGVARAGARVHAIFLVSEKEDWSTFTRDETAFLEAIASSFAMRMENLRLERELQRHQDSAVQALAAAIEVKDRYTAGHTRRVGAYADALLAHLPVADAEKKKIRLAGILHDIGKIGVPDRILLKPGRLSPDEWDEMRLHTEAGFDIVSRVAGLEEIAEILRHHHERWDGSGYPRGLQGEEIPYASRIIAVADTFDAIVTDRPYQAAKTPQEAKTIIEGLEGRYFESSIVAAFRAAFPRLEALALGVSKNI